MPAASVSIHSMRRRRITRAGSGSSVSCDIAVTMQADSSAVGRTRGYGPAPERAAPSPGGGRARRRAVGAPAARSVLLTVLGEYVLPAPGGAWQETLIAALGATGHKTHAARQALARSVAAGWLVTERHGRRSRAHLTPETAEMLRSGAERIYSFGEPWAW